MDGFIVTLALPAMARDFGAGISSIKWAVVAYLGTVTVSLLFAGRLADLWGRRNVTIAGMALHTLAAALCIFAPTLGLLLALRTLQGFGGALVLANVMAEIAAVFPRDRRRLAMGVNASVLALGQVAGLVGGGLLTGWYGWRSIFLVAVAVGLVGLALDIAVLEKRPLAARPASMDWPGAVLSVAVVGTPFLMLERISHDGGSAGLRLALLGGALLCLFVVMERRSRRPLLDLALFRSRGYVCGALSACGYFVAATSCYFLLPLFFQIVGGLSPLMAGLAMVPLAAALTLTSQVSPRLTAGISARALTTAGLLCVTTGVLALSTFGRSAPYVHWLGPLLLLGFGGGLFHPPNNTAVLADVPPEELGVANGFFTTARNFGQAIGASLAAEILAHHLGPADALRVLAGAGSISSAAAFPAYMAGQSAAFQVAAVLGLAGAIVSALRGGESHQHAPAPARAPR